MHFIFMTRCFRTTNLLKIKESISKAFSNTSEHTYTHLIIVDLTKGQKEQIFNDFKDSNTVLYFVHSKTDDDKYITKGVDEALEQFNREAYCYMLDDDNLVKENFLVICKEINYDTDDIIIFKVINHENWGQIANKTNAIGLIDWSSFITKLSVMKQLKIYNGENSQQADGRFINKVKSSKYKFKFSNQIIATYNTLPRPT